jgi:hypothetical protein
MPAGSKLPSLRISLTKNLRRENLYDFFEITKGKAQVVATAKWLHK